LVAAVAAAAAAEVGRRQRGQGWFVAKPAVLLPVAVVFWKLLCRQLARQALLMTLLLAAVVMEL
jgi:hypothetical protein